MICTIEQFSAEDRSKLGGARNEPAIRESPRTSQCPVRPCPFVPKAGKPLVSFGQVFPCPTLPAACRLPYLFIGLFSLKNTLPISFFTVLKRYLLLKSQLLIIYKALDLFLKRSFIVKVRVRFVLHGSYLLCVCELGLMHIFP